MGPIRCPFVPELAPLYVVGHSGERTPASLSAGEAESKRETDVALAIAHEAAPLRRHDLTWNALAAVVHVLLYFHPAIWLAHRRMRLEQEMACDELVLQKLSAAPQDYGRMLLSTVRRLAAL